MEIPNPDPCENVCNIVVYRKQFVLENELHILYLIVPIYAAVSWPKLSWLTFLTMWEGLRYTALNWL
jgi:hypothetical protein